MINGQAMGCTDGQPPATSEYELSRLHDALLAATEAHLDMGAVFKLASTEAKLDYNYSRWFYRAKTA